jgi:hypothetical protein
MSHATHLHKLAFAEVDELVAIKLVLANDHRVALCPRRRPAIAFTLEFLPEGPEPYKLLVSVTRERQDTQCVQSPISYWLVLQEKGKTHNAYRALLAIG